MIDKNLLKRLIAEYQEFATNVPFLRRDIPVDCSHCNVFVGLRRAGKSYLMYQCIRELINQGLPKEAILYFNFEDDRLPNPALIDLERIKVCFEEMHNVKPVFFLDEVQIVDGWAKFARRLADTGYKVFITGSNAKMLSSEIASTLGGRYAITEVYPFSFSEYLKSKGLELPANWEYSPCLDIRRAFAEYFKTGGLPEVVATEPEYKRKWLSGLFDRVYYGDLIARNGIRKQNSLKVLIRKIISSIGQPLSVNRAAAIVSAAGSPLKPDTASDYIEYADNAWLIFPIENYHGKLSERVSLKKYYLIDNGIVSLFEDEAWDHLLENLVAVTLRKIYGEEVHFYKDNIELDFYVPSENIGIQVSYTIEESATREREVKALRRMHAYQPLSQAIVITYDEEDEIHTEEGLTIQVIPVWKWLLLKNERDHCFPEV